MFGALLLLLLLVPFVELWVIVGAWQLIGGPETLLLLVGISVLGAWLVKREGLGVWFRLNEQLTQGRLPTDELVDGAIILFAGALLLTPGFITDAVGLLMLFPPTRAGLRVLAERRLRRRVEQGTGGIRVVRWASWGPGGPATPGATGSWTRVVDVDSDVVDAELVDDAPARRPGPPPELGP